jgi:hypothetical protein
MIEVQDGLFIEPRHVIAVKAISEKKCLVFFKGNSALDGFTVDKPALEVADRVEEEMEAED